MTIWKIGYADPFIYYGKVTGQVLSLIGKHQKISLPFPSHFAEAQGALGQFFTSFQNGSWRKVTLGQVGQILGETVKIGGFFVVGEMVGRWSLVGYDIPG